MSSAGSRQRRSSPGAGSRPRDLRALRVSAIEHYCLSKGLKLDEWKALKAKAENVLRSHGVRISVSVHADDKSARIECRVPSDSSTGSTYIQHIDFNSIGTRINGHTCECPSHRKSERRQDVVCKHVVAALLRYITRFREASDGSPPACSNSSSSSSSSSNNNRSSSNSSEHRGTRSTPGSTSGRGEHSTHPASSDCQTRGDVWGLLEPVGSMKSALRGYESTRVEFAGLIELHRSVIKLGKDVDCDINMCTSVGVGHFKTVSTNHAIVKPSKLEDTQKPSWGKNRFLAIWDDTSSNGTHINGTLVKKGTSKELHEGDRIKLGKEAEKVHFIFVRPLICALCRFYVRVTELILPMTALPESLSFDSNSRRVSADRVADRSQRAAA